jgi:hypothetical protein
VDTVRRIILVEVKLAAEYPLERVRVSAVRSFDKLKRSECGSELLDPNDRENWTGTVGELVRQAMEGK